MPRLLIAIIFFVASGIAVVFYLRPEWQNFQSLARQVGEMEEISQEFDELTANRDQLLGLVNSITKDNLTRLDQILPQGPNSSQFLASIEALTLANSVALRRIDLVSPSTERAEPLGRSGASQPRPVTDTAAFVREPGQTEELPFTLQVSTTYAGFKKFLTGLEKNLRMIDVDEIGFSAGSKTEIMDFSIKAKTYYQ